MTQKPDFTPYRLAQEQMESQMRQNNTAFFSGGSQQKVSQSQRAENIGGSPAKDRTMRKPSRQTNMSTYGHKNNQILESHATGKSLN